MPLNMYKWMCICTNVIPMTWNLVVKDHGISPECKAIYRVGENQIETRKNAQHVSVYHYPLFCHTSSHPAQV